MAGCKRLLAAERRRRLVWPRGLTPAVAGARQPRGPRGAVPSPLPCSPTTFLSPLCYTFMLYPTL